MFLLLLLRLVNRTSLYQTISKKLKHPPLKFFTLYQTILRNKPGMMLHLVFFVKK
jgi:hypothetical protein